MMDDKDQRIAITAGIIMNSSDRGSGCPVCGYEAWGPEWTKVLRLAEEIVKTIDEVGYEYWRQSSHDTGVTPKDTDTPLERAHRSGGVLYGKNET